MAERTSFTSTVLIIRPTTARLGGHVVVMPFLKKLTESTYRSGAWDTVTSAGIVAPAWSGTQAADSGVAGNPNGTYAYYVTFYDSARDLEGDESAQSNSVSVSSKKITLDLTTITNEASDSSFDKIRIYRNQNGGSTYYRVATVDKTDASYTDDSSDATISAADTLELDNTPPSGSTFGHCLAHKSRVFLYGSYSPTGQTAYSDAITYSKVNEPQAYPSVNLVLVEPGMYGWLRSVRPAGDALLCYKDFAIYRWTWDDDPSFLAGGVGRVVNNVRGTVNERTVVNVQGTHYSLDTFGIFRTRDGINIEILDRQLTRYWNRINWSVRDKFHGAASDKALSFFVALDEDTECRWRFTLDLTVLQARGEIRWYAHKYDFGIRDSASVVIGSSSAATTFDTHGVNAIAILTDTGYFAYLDAGFRDLVDPFVSATGTVTSSSTSSVTDSAGSFTRSNELSETVSPKGAYLRFLTLPNADKPTSEAWSQAYRITAATATQITVTPNFPAAPPTGATFVIGAIPEAYLKTPPTSFGDIKAVKTLDGVTLEHAQAGHGFTIGVGYSLDRREPEEVVAAKTESAVTATAGASEYTVEIGGAYGSSGRRGIVEVPTPDRSFRTAQIILNGTGVDKPAIIDGMSLDVGGGLGGG